MEVWENLGIIEINKEKGRCMANTYATVKDAIDQRSPIDQMSLNGIWKFCCSQSPDERPVDFYKEEYDVSGWDNLEVPCCWETKGYGQPWYFATDYPPAIGKKIRKIPQIDHSRNVVGSYRRTFTLPEGWKDKELLLNFGSVKSAFFLWINGHKAGYSQVSMVPAEFNITPYVRPGENTIALEVYQFSDATYLECQDMWYLSGIYRDVILYAEPKTHIRDVYIKNDFDNEYKDAAVEAQISIENKGKLAGCTVELEFYDADGKLSMAPITSACDTDGKALLKGICKAPMKWSAEMPYLYTAVITLKNAKGEVLQIKALKYGFRKIEIKNEMFMINGKAVKLKGMNVHSWHPDYGYHVPKEVIKEDILRLKRNNVNAIRTSHYPLDSYFYELCDYYGIYVMDECNLETHGLRKKIPGSDPRFTEACVDRMRRMVLRDRNHACVIIWSLGNEAGYGSNFKAMREAAEELDTTRKFHYEGDRDLGVCDFVSMMYPSLEKERIFAERKDFKLGLLDNVQNILAADNKGFTYKQYKGYPIMNCELISGIGNCMSELKKHVDLYEKYDNWAGVFLWDYVDKDIRKVQKVNGREFWAYGGDYNEGKSSQHIVCSGFLRSDRTPHHNFYNIKKCYQNVEVKLAGQNILEIYNKYNFKSLDFITLQWSVIKNGEIVAKGVSDIPEIKPRDKGTVQVEYSSAVKNDGADYFLNLDFALKEDMSWAKKGHVVAYDQICLVEGLNLPYGRAMNKQSTIGGEVSILDQKDKVKLKAAKTSIVISKETGNVEELDFGYGNLFKTPLRPSLYRAMTDADYGAAMLLFGYKPKSSLYRSITRGKKIPVKKFIVRKANESVTVHILQKAGGRLERQYSLRADGKLKVEETMVPSKNISKIGMQVELPEDFRNIRWYGMGPHDSYSDRNESTRIGIWSKKVEEDQDLYVRPQEHGNKSEVRWAEVSDNKGNGIRITAVERKINISAWPYTLVDLDNAMHIHEIPERDTVTLNIDGMQKGLGELISPQGEEYHLKKGETYSYSFIIEDKQRP